MEISIDEGRRGCPVCGGSNTLNVSNNEGSLLLHCHKCEAPFKVLLNALGGTLPTKAHQPLARKNSKSTHAQAAAKARRIWEAAK